MARLFLALVVLLSFVMCVAPTRPATATTDAGDCDQDLRDLISNCQQYVQFPADPKIPPSQACCAVIQRANIPCLCSKVTPSIEAIICMDKVVYVANYCKRPLQPGSNCGSKFLPVDSTTPGWFSYLQIRLTYAVFFSFVNIDLRYCDCFNLQAITFLVVRSHDALFCLSLRQQWVLIIHLHICIDVICLSMRWEGVVPLAVSPE